MLFLGVHPVWVKAFNQTRTTFSSTAVNRRMMGSNMTPCIQKHFCEHVSTDCRSSASFFFLHFLVAVFCCLQSATSLRDATKSYNPTTFKFHFMETKAVE